LRNGFALGHVEGGLFEIESLVTLPAVQSAAATLLGVPRETHEHNAGLGPLCIGGWGGGIPIGEEKFRIRFMPLNRACHTIAPNPSKASGLRANGIFPSRQGFPPCQLLPNRQCILRIPDDFKHVPARQINLIACPLIECPFLLRIEQAVFLDNLDGSLFGLRVIRRVTHTENGVTPQGYFLGLQCGQGVGDKNFPGRINRITGIEPQCGVLQPKHGMVAVFEHHPNRAIFEDFDRPGSLGKMEFGRGDMPDEIIRIQTLVEQCSLRVCGKIGGAVLAEIGFGLRIADKIEPLRQSIIQAVLKPQLKKSL